MASDQVRRLTLAAFLSSVGIALFVLESFIPTPLPFMKLGLANVATVLALLLLGPGDAILVIAVRIVAGSLLTGTLFSPGFLLSASAGCASACAMIITRKLTGSLFSPVGLSLVGSVIHVLTQYGIVRYLFVRSGTIALLVPFLLLSALVGGLVVGWMSRWLLLAVPAAGILAGKR